MASKAEIAAAFRMQAEWCQRLGSPFTATLATLSAQALERGGLLGDLIGDWPGEPTADGLPLRFFGALHALVLSGDDPALAALYPPRQAGPALWPAVEAAMAARPDHFRRFLLLAPQTNEVRRSALLLPGFAAIARRARRPLRLLEIGASAGLNTIWDKYRYRYTGGPVWGDAASTVEISCEGRGAPLDLGGAIEVRDRAACDQAPIDLADPAQIHRLRAYIWPDQPDRLARLDAATTLALKLGVTVERADAADWIERRLVRPAGDVVTVLYHSVVWQYLPQATRERIRAAMGAFGAAHPLAWLALESEGRDAPYALRLTYWPGDGTRTKAKLAEVSPHGVWLNWLGNALS